MLNDFYLDIFNNVLKYLTIFDIYTLEGVNKKLKKNIKNPYFNKYFKRLIKKKYPNIVNLSLPYYNIFKKIHNYRYKCLKCDKLLNINFNVTLIISLKDNSEIFLHNYHTYCIDTVSNTLSMNLYKCPLTNNEVSGWKCRYI